LSILLALPGAVVPPRLRKPIIERDKPFEESQCEHVEWVYLDELGAFIFAHPSVQAVIDDLCAKADESDDDDSDLVEELHKLWGGPTRAVLTLTTWVMACGPVWSTVRFGLNFITDSPSPTE
jgi:hypothetical protein